MSSAGYRVLTAESGEEAVRLAMQEVPELNFTEARLPIVDGWSLIEVLRADPALGGAALDPVGLALLREGGKTRL